MREVYLNTMKRHFGNYLKSERLSKKLTQAAMADILRISGRSYTKLEHAESCCSGLTLALFLIYASSDPISFLDELRLALEQNSDALV